MSDNFLETESLFCEETFTILEKLYNDPFKNSYSKNKNDFIKYVEEPFQRLFRQVTKKLSNYILQPLEPLEPPILIWGVLDNWSRPMSNYGGLFYFTKDLFSRFNLFTNIINSDTFLFINIKKTEVLQFGFSINKVIGIERKRFINNCQKNYETLTNLLRENLDSNSLVYGDYRSTPLPLFDPCSWEDWLKNPEKEGLKVALYLNKDEILQYSTSELIDLIAQTFIRLFPLVLLAIFDDPITAILKCVNNPIYNLIQFAEDTVFDKNTLKRWVRAINRKGQAIIQGPPGTGKTYLAEKLARHLIGGGHGFTELVQFHPAYSYEDFMQGMRPQTGNNGQLTYPVVPGRFLEFCKKAESCQDLCVLIIDEINRANLSQVFGELMYLLEYRDKKIPLAGSSEPFGIPENVRIIGTMNTADRSIALVDHALRRRFAFINLYPNYEVLRRYHQKNTGFSVEGLIKILEKLNQNIDDPHYQLGISFFLTNNLDDELEEIWRMEIEPYLEEYFFDRRDKVEEFRWDKVAIEIAQ